MGETVLLTTLLTEEQKLKVAGSGRWAFRARVRRLCKVGRVSCARLLSWRLKLTGQAQWMMSVVSVRRVL